jgi:hypothetical protein
VAETLNTEVEELHSRSAHDAAALSAAEDALAAVRRELGAAYIRVADLEEAAARQTHERSYAQETHFLFAPGADGYELLKRSGPAPAAGELVALSGGRTCRVLRVGPPPFPGALEACCYLQLA